MDPNEQVWAQGYIALSSLSNSASERNVRNLGGVHALPPPAVHRGSAVG